MVDRASSSITVDAPKATVMAVIADFEAYPEWAQFIKRAEVLQTGPDGRPARVRFHLDAGPVSDVYTLGYDWDGDDRVSWHLVESSKLKAQDGSYRLADAAGGTEVTYELAVELKIRMIGMLKRKAEGMIIDTALNGLKKRVESLPPPG